MPTTNDFLPFAVGAGANVLSQSDYAALAALTSGFQAGTAISSQLNKVWRQSSIMSAVLAQFIVNNSGESAADDGTTATLLANFTGAVRALTRQQVVLADTGAANAYAATNATPLVAGTWIDGVVQAVKIAHANTGAATYAPDGLAAIPIYGLGLQPLQGGEIFLNGTAILMRVTIPGVNSGNPICVLMECAGGAQQVAPATQSQHAPQLGQLFPSISASVASNALSLQLAAPTALAFRNASLTSGTPVIGSIPSNLSLTVPSGATLGTVSGTQAMLAVVVAYNAGTPVLCVANIAGGVDLSETNLISPTTISGSSNSPSTIYSASSVSANSPYRVVGYIQIAETTAGTWATAPTSVQGAGGQAFAALSSFGYGQTWQNVLASRSIATTYYNTTGRPILVSATVASMTTTNGAPYFVISGVQAANGSSCPTNGSAIWASVEVIVPPGASYALGISTGGATLVAWTELR